MYGSILPQLLLAGGLLQNLVSADEASCFAPDGETMADNTTYVPCNKLGIEQDGVFSSCCNLDGEPDERDLCTSQGLCLNGGVFFRGYCTDDSWESDACVKVCMDDENGGNSTGMAELTPCGDNKYCCGHDNVSCCGTEDAFEIPQLVNIDIDQGEEDDSSPPPVDTSNLVSSSFKSATIGLAVVSGLAVVAALGAFFFFRRKNAALQNELNNRPATSQVQSPPTMYQQSDAGYYDHNNNNYVGAPSSMGSPVPYNEYPYKHTSSLIAPASPMPSEANTHQRYSELDSTVVTRHEVASPPIPEHPSSPPARDH